MKLKNIHHEITIHAAPEHLWEVLSQYGDVYSFHGGVLESHTEAGSDNVASLGCERVCNIVDMGLKIMLKERIIEYVEGCSYRYEVYEWKNFPVQKMFFGFTIVASTPIEVRLAIDIDYLAKPALLTPILIPKMKSLARDVLLGYKHYAETGERRVPIGVLKRRYRNLQPAVA
ncbi:hypothetical protein MNBD_GAMMA15-2437 [hydrothermal vent metagenome]|uniref:Coenzyme Q-binding protein COQ10 START domain-containing protein n=1 Tax=hydrothermal vent metagenome TaxID=652676 RepID=A0A3B0YHE1_9ZZZZ